MTSETPLLVEYRNKIAVVTINRPKVHNAMNPELICRLADLWDEINADDSIRAAVITGAGSRTFCSGGDLATALPLLTGVRTPVDDWDRRVVADPNIAGRATLKGVVMEKPIVAAINGACLAGGMEMVVGAHLRIASEQATFGLPEPKHGLIPFGGSLVRLPRQIPHVRAMELLLTGDIISAQQALDYGFVNRVVPQQEVLSQALALAEKIAVNGPIAVQEILRTVSHASGRNLTEAFEIETKGMERIMASTDAREGPAAFIEKRKPIFSGT